MRAEIVKQAAKRGVILDPELTELCLCQDDPVRFIDEVISSAKGKFHVCLRDLPTDFHDTVEKTRVESVPRPRSVAPVRRGDIRVIEGTDITGESTCEGKIEDFSRYFQNRFRTLRKLLERRRELAGAMPLERAMKMDREVKVIGMVAEVNNTKNGHRILMLEDDSGESKVFISKESPLIDDFIVPDEVIGVVGKPTGKKEMLIANDIVHPDIPRDNRMSPNDSTSQIGFLCDVHVGSSTFLQRQWDNMISWLKEESANVGLHYLVLPGDVVDGIGIFPGHLEELTIKSIYGQYERTAEMLKDIPDHITVVVQPGNHDSVRPAEPQPALADVFANCFDSNIMMIGNPAYLEVEGRTVLSYHGRSMDDWISSVQSLSYEQPLKVMEEMLKRRHLAPIYGKRTPLAPEKRDYMVIDRIPDIFVTGHVHGAGSAEYRGVKMINASTWQSQTEFQKMHNFNPDPAILPLVHLGTGKVTMMDFN